MTVDVLKDGITQLVKESKTGLGGSDIAALFGKSPWKTLHEVYMAKVGLTKPETAPELLVYQEIGLEVEPALTRMFLRRRPGKAVIEHPEFMRSEDHPWMIGHLDGIICDLDGVQEGVLEIKTAGWGKSGDWGLEGTDEVPENYNLQVHHYMALTGLKYAEIAVLVGGSDFKIYRVERNEELIAVLIAQGSYFWDTYVLPQVPPPIDGTKGATRMLRALYPDSDDTQMDASDELHQTVLKFFRKQAEVKELSAEELALKNEIIASMAESGMLAGPGYKITNKRTKDGTKIDYKGLIAEAGVRQEVIDAYTTEKPGYRVFRPGKLKEVQ